MTTIAYRDGVMASDSQITGDYLSHGQKLFKRRGMLIGIAGDVGAAMAFVDWYVDRRKPQPPRAGAGDHESRWEALVVTKTKLEFWDHNLRPVTIAEEYAALGSGSAYAIAAMDCGKSAAAAVRVAIRRDDGSGGRVCTIRMEAK